MASNPELQEKHRQQLAMLLRIKKAPAEKKSEVVQEEIKAVLSLMDKDDVAWVEKINEVKAL